MFSEFSLFYLIFISFIFIDTVCITLINPLPVVGPYWARLLLAHFTLNILRDNLLIEWKRLFSFQLQKKTQISDRINEWNVNFYKKSTKHKQILAKKQKRAAKASRGRLTAFLDIILVPQFLFKHFVRLHFVFVRKIRVQMLSWLRIRNTVEFAPKSWIGDLWAVRGKKYSVHFFRQSWEKTQSSGILMNLWQTNFYAGNKIRYFWKNPSQL